MKGRIHLANINNLITKAKDPTTAIFGVDMNGEPYVEEISSGPHWLVAGTTGSGKSVSVNAMLISVMYHATPEELELFAIDPKKVEFANYEGLPYLPVDPITNMGDAYGLLAYLVLEMEEKYRQLERLGFKNIHTFNEWVINNPEEVAEKNKEFDALNANLRDDEMPYRKVEKMKFTICVIDEFAELMTDPNSKGCEDLIISLAQKARAAGIHLIVATQRPSAEVMPPLIRSNIPSRLGLRVGSPSDSGIILGEVPEGYITADKLNGKGDTIVKDASGKFTRIQAPFFDETTTNIIFEYLRNKFDRVPFVDYKAITVNDKTGRVEVEWVEDYDDDVPWEKRRVKKAARRRR